MKWSAILITIAASFAGCRTPSATSMVEPAPGVTAPVSSATPTQASSAAASSDATGSVADGPGTPTQTPSAARCADVRPPVTRCGRDEDCAVAWRYADCCGTERAVGVARSDLERYAEQERRCPTVVYACRCRSDRPRADDGSVGDRRSVTVACVEGVCATSFVH